MLQDLSIRVVVEVGEMEMDREMGEAGEMEMDREMGEVGEVEEVLVLPKM